jgi:hypothetical protein
LPVGSSASTTAGSCASARDRHSLLLAAGEPIDGAVQPIAESDLAENRGAALAGGGPAYPVQLQREADVLLDVKGRDEIEELIDEPEVRAPEERAFRLPHRGHDPPADLHLAAVGAVDPAHEIEQGRLARAAAADDCDHLPPAEAGIGSIEHPVHAGPLAEAAAELADYDQSGRSPKEPQPAADQYTIPR